MNEEQNYINFDEYKKASEPHKRERAEAWRVAIGLQAVDGLQVSEYLKQTARQHIEGEITIDEAREQIKQYYISKTQHDADDEVVISIFPSITCICDMESIQMIEEELNDLIASIKDAKNSDEDEDLDTED